MKTGKRIKRANPAVRLGLKLTGARLTLSSAESCTGGMVSQVITSVPGSSAYFLGGIVAYSNGVKRRLLGVSAQTLKDHGAVSAECAEEMARGAAEAFGSDCAFSVTGIAGPGGGTPGKPAGLVYFSLLAGGRSRTFRRVFPGGRKMVREAAATLVLQELIKIIK